MSLDNSHEIAYICRVIREYVIDNHDVTYQSIKSVFKSEDLWKLPSALDRLINNQVLVRKFDKKSCDFIYKIWV